MTVSNNLLVFLLVVVLIVAVVGTVMTIDKVSKFAFFTGYGTQGNVSVTISGQVEINVTQPYCTFGSGYVTAPYEYAILHPGTNVSNAFCPSDNDTKDNWTNETSYDPDCMEVRNDGNVRIWVNVSSGKNPADMIGGTNPNVTAWSENKESDSCASSALVNKVDYPGIEMNTSNRTMCSCLYPEDTRDEIYVGCYLKIPGDTYGSKSDSWIFTAATATNVPDCGSL